MNCKKQFGNLITKKTGKQVKRQALVKRFFLKRYILSVIPTSLTIIFKGQQSDTNKLSLELEKPMSTKAA